MEGHGASLPIKAQGLGKVHVRPIAIPLCRGTVLGVGGDVGRGIHDGPVDVTGDVIQGIDFLVGRSLGTRSQEKGQMAACGHADDAYLLRVETPLGGLASNQSHSPLSVFPGTLPYWKSDGTRCPVHEVHALEPETGEFLPPHLDEPHVTAVHVGPSGNEYHAPSVGVTGCIEPLKVRDAMLVGIEALEVGLVRHCGYLVALCIGHPVLGPNAFPLECSPGREAKQ